MVSQLLRDTCKFLKVSSPFEHPHLPSLAYGFCLPVHNIAASFPGTVAAFQVEERKVVMVKRCMCIVCCFCLFIWKKILSRNST